tara:strand:+ start:60 stop:560 length:501 start_codon:yes stop_codon:yes gene_type:complete
MTIVQLKNPKTKQYESLKNYILSNNFPWYYNKWMDGTLWFSHGVLIRPTEDKKYSTVNNENILQFQKVLDEIFDYNNLYLNCLFRINVNLITPKKKVQVTPFHNDHYWSHNNMVIYFTDAGGRTLVEDEKFDPKEDDIITFSGYPEKHSFEIPTKNDRIVMIITYI